jgi:hypothetical protein
MVSDNCLARLVEKLLERFQAPASANDSVTAGRNRKEHHHAIIVPEDRESVIRPEYEAIV